MLLTTEHTAPQANPTSSTQQGKESKKGARVGWNPWPRGAGATEMDSSTHT